MPAQYAVQNEFIRPAFFMKQVNFLNKIVTSYFEHIINYANRLLQLSQTLHCNKS